MHQEMDPIPNKCQTYTQYNEKGPSQTMLLLSKKSRKEKKSSYSKW